MLSSFFTGVSVSEASGTPGTGVAGGLLGPTAGIALVSTTLLWWKLLAKSTSNGTKALKTYMITLTVHCPRRTRDLHETKIHLKSEIVENNRRREIQCCCELGIANNDASRDCNNGRCQARIQSRVHFAGDSEMTSRARVHFDSFFPHHAFKTK
jgi:transposase-like protein